MSEKTYTDTPSKPALTLPAGACDAHVHVFGPCARFPYAVERSFTPADAGKESLFALHRHLGISRCVIVQSACHGFDNSAVADAIAAGQGKYLGVALAPVDMSDSELAVLAAQGFRAVRFNFMRHLAGAPVEDVLALTPRLAALGMHLQVHFESSLVHSVGAQLQASAVPVVIDHMGRVDARLGAAHEDFQALQGLLARNPQFYVKVSGVDRIDSVPPYIHGKPLARQLVERFPQQCLWGTDWPHPNHTHIPDDGQLVDALAEIAPTPQLLQALLVDNPQRLYQF
ncbi:amidohydrolase family protein [Comamonas endophytica]|uniref:Amidohydrolase family protein n=1 Tax=Comamonas endophytica TaxID=2949090 RepID=A0ABY6G9Y4_9BURK|nr:MULTISPECIES: amidohydrolase family protein [unclassified Acidovorax]MCD2514058.1 amidohydrolase family protein [Acidovorax sp. D4N7]UYG51202.1 amidohydrolase family protein [Acidovorax sp. 5MLIR]